MGSGLGQDPPSFRSVLQVFGNTKRIFQLDFANTLKSRSFEIPRKTKMNLKNQLPRETEGMITVFN